MLPSTTGSGAMNAQIHSPCKSLVTKEMKKTGMRPVKIREWFRFETASCYAAQAGLETSMAFEVPSTSAWLC